MLLYLTTNASSVFPSLCPLPGAQQHLQMYIPFSSQLLQRNHLGGNAFRKMHQEIEFMLCQPCVLEYLILLQGLSINTFEDLDCHCDHNP